MLGIGSDHWGIELKDRLLRHLLARELQVQDFGAFSAEPVDYPDIAQLVAEAVAAGSIVRGVLICRTGLGMAIAANKVPGVYAATVHNLETARAAAASNKAQIITLGSEMVSPTRACAIVEEWLHTPFKGGQSALKLEKIHCLEMKFQDSHQVGRGG